MFTLCAPLLSRTWILIQRPTGFLRAAVVCAGIFATLPLCHLRADDGEKVKSDDGEKDNGDDGEKAGRWVVVGDSLSAGFQNFSLFDGNTAPFVGGVQHGYAALVAKQAGVNLPQRLISYPGIPPALQLTPGGTIVRATGTGSPENLTVQALNLSVPGFSLVDSLAHTFPGNPGNAIDVMSSLVLGFPGAFGPGLVPSGCGPVLSNLLPFPVTSPTLLVVSEAACAVALKPTTILVSTGNNDALQALTFGLPPTNPNVFAVQYATLLGVLATSRAKIVVSNIPDVSAVPFLVPEPVFVGLCGFTPVGPPSYTVTAADFVVPDILSVGLTSVNICLHYGFRPAALIAQTRSAVAAYNQIIDALARSFGAVVVDVNGLFADLAVHGYKLDDQRLTTAFLGGLFSLDAIHPSNTGYAILANEVIKTMNKRLDTEIDTVSVEDVAENDPLVPKH